MEIGIDSFAAAVADTNGLLIAPENRLANLLEEIRLADEVGLDAFGIGEHHRAEYLDSAPTVILAAASTVTSRIRLTSAVTVLSAADPVRVFQQFATLDLISRGRAEIVAGRGSFVEAYPLFGLNLDDYDALFVEKLDLLLRIRDNPTLTWRGKYRPALIEQSVYPRPIQNPLPVWVGVGGTPASFVRAGVLGLPLMVAIIGGDPRQFAPLIDAYRAAGKRAGHPPEALKVGLHMIGFVGETDEAAAEAFFPGYADTFAKIGRERGWPAITRKKFDQERDYYGALLVGAPQAVAEKALRFSRELGGVSRLNFQMTIATPKHEDMLRSIRLLGTRVAPFVREAADSLGRTAASAGQPRA